MISCQAFRTNLKPGSSDAAILEHLRNCDVCLDYAVTVDPDTFFRALGGEEIEPPGGVEAFATDVMAQIRLRQAESSVAHRLLISPRRLAAAAAITATLGIAALVYDQPRHQAPAAHPVAAAVTRSVPAATKQIVETYQSGKATIIEMPAADPHEPRVVMIFDDSLPADL